MDPTPDNKSCDGEELQEYPESSEHEINKNLSEIQSELYQELDADLKFKEHCLSKYPNVTDNDTDTSESEIALPLITKEEETSVTQELVVCELCNLKLPVYDLRYHILTEHC